MFLQNTTEVDVGLLAAFKTLHRVIQNESGWLPTCDYIKKLVRRQMYCYYFKAIYYTCISKR